MAKAVVVHNISKKYSPPGADRWGQRPNIGRRSENSGYFSRGFNEQIVLEKVSFQVEESEIFGIVGGQGSGKSTLFQILGALIQPDEGEVRILGSDLVRQPAQARRWINRISVEASFFKQLTPIKNLLQGFSQNQNPDEMHGRALNLLMGLGLESDQIVTPMENLSRSVQQIVCVAGALLSRPRVLLLDEPARGLDSEARCRVYRLIIELRCEQGTTVLFTTRDPREVLAVSDRAVKLEAGHIVPFGMNQSEKRQWDSPCCQHSDPTLSIHTCMEAAYHANR